MESHQNTHFYGYSSLQVLNLWEVTSCLIWKLDKVYFPFDDLRSKGSSTSIYNTARVPNHKALVQNLLAFAKGVFSKCILRRHSNFNLVAALVLGRLLLRALRNCEKIMH